MIDNSLVNKINKGEISSRRQLYKVVGRSRKLLQWLNDNNVLVPRKWTKEKFDMELLKVDNTRAQDNWNLVRIARRFYGTWNNALRDVLGVINQHRYNELTDEDLKQSIVRYVTKYKRLPLREEFNGRSYEFPDWESIATRLGFKKWSDVLGSIDLSSVQYYNDTKHGTGKVYIYNGITYLSRQEYLIGKFLTKRGVLFKKEVPYDNCGYVFDFKLLDHNVYIEYYGMATVDYMKRVEKKRKMYAGRKVIEIFKHDNTIGKLDLEVQRL